MKKTRFGHFNVDPKIQTETDPKIFDSKSNRKFTNIFRFKFILSKKSKPKKTDLKKSESEKNRSK